jgi:protein YIPF6
VAQSENIELTDRDKQIIESLRDWDLWGPLIVCLALAVLLSFNAPVGQASLVFATVFCAVWFGAAVVTINTQLLGGTISFFQSVCVLGYCVFPMTMAAVVVMLFKMLPLGAFSVLVEIAVLLVAFLWSTRASSVFIGQYIVASRRVLAVRKHNISSSLLLLLFFKASLTLLFRSQQFPGVPRLVLLHLFGLAGFTVLDAPYVMISYHVTGTNVHSFYLVRSRI